jgi:hypothetical protein
MTYKASLRDTDLYELFDRLGDAGRRENTFHDGWIRKHHDFRDLVRRDDVHFWALNGDGNQWGMFWITDLRHGAANIHFAMLGSAHPVSEVRIARFAVASLLHRMKDGKGFLVDFLHGTTPARNEAACRWIRKVGFMPVGEVPGAVWMADTERLEPALISCATRETAPEDWIRSAVPF